MYSAEGLENGIETCRKNITVLEGAIERERETIKEYRVMIYDIERAAKEKEAAERNVHLEIVRDNKD